MVDGWVVGRSDQSRTAKVAARHGRGMRAFGGRLDGGGREDVLDDEQSYGNWQIERTAGTRGGRGSRMMGASWWRKRRMFGKRPTGRRWFLAAAPVSRLLRTLTGGAGAGAGAASEQGCPSFLPSGWLACPGRALLPSTLAGSR